MCNCKNKSPQPQKIQMVKQDDAIQIVELEEPPYTLEEVQRVREYFFAKIKTESERNYIIEWNRKYFEPQQQGYCDPVCIDRINTRAQHAYQKLQEYVKYTTSRQTQENS